MFIFYNHVWTAEKSVVFVSAPKGRHYAGFRWCLEILESLWILGGKSRPWKFLKKKTLIHIVESPWMDVFCSRIEMKVLLILPASSYCVVTVINLDLCFKLCCVGSLKLKELDLEVLKVLEFDVLEGVGIKTFYTIPTDCREQSSEVDELPSAKTVNMFPSDNQTGFILTIQHHVVFVKMFLSVLVCCKWTCHPVISLLLPTAALQFIHS